MTNSHVAAAIAMVSGALGIGCHEEYQPQQRMTPASGWEPRSTPDDPAGTTPTPNLADEPGTRTLHQAIDGITEARCAHQDQCGRIGPNRSFATWNECMREEHGPARANLLECSARVSDDALTTCVNDLRAQDCDSMQDSVDRMPSCNVERLCTAGVKSDEGPKAPHEP